ncbi:MAG: SDR family NAD(P)-dependent oxidoreductase, partial [Firmicutes bacterium]|nr:SDR family NAD(P)-dependent oxidoreductase [Bacillota bacterium]
MKMYDFDGKVAVVTGAGGEMAGAMVKKFTENGACAALLDIREDLAQKTADALGLGEDKALCVKVDISDEESVKAAVQKIMDKFGRIDF